MMQRVLMRDPTIRDWLAGTCFLQRPAADRPSNIEMDIPFHVGDQTVHDTHQMRQYNGFVYGPHGLFYNSSLKKRQILLLATQVSTFKCLLEYSTAVSWSIRQYSWVAPPLTVASQVPFSSFWISLENLSFCVHVSL